MNRFYQVLLILAFGAWMAFWFWAFTFQFSSSFFRYHLDSRVPITAMALLAVAVAPLSGYRAITRSIHRKCGPIQAVGVHLLVSAVPIGLFWGVTTLWVVLARRLGSLAFEADEAMGYGIDFMLCFGVFLASNMIVVGTLIIWKLKSNFAHRS